MTDSWYCIIFGQELGPLPLGEIWMMVKRGMLVRTDSVRTGTQSEWQPAENFPQLFAEENPAPVRRNALAVNRPADAENGGKATVAAGTGIDTVTGALGSSLTDEQLASSDWYCKVLGGEFGPMDLAGLQRFVADKLLTPLDQVRLSATGAWRPATFVDGLFSAGAYVNQWYCRIMNEEMGPLHWDDLTRMAASGMLSRRDKVRLASNSKWTEARLVPGLIAKQEAAPQDTDFEIDMPDDMLPDNEASPASEAGDVFDLAPSVIAANAAADAADLAAEGEASEPAEAPRGSAKASLAKPAPQPAAGKQNQTPAAKKAPAAKAPVAKTSPEAPAAAKPAQSPPAKPSAAAASAGTPTTKPGEAPKSGTPTTTGAATKPGAAAASQPSASKPPASKPSASSPAGGKPGPSKPAGGEAIPPTAAAPSTADTAAAAGKPSGDAPTDKPKKRLFGLLGGKSKGTTTDATETGLDSQRPEGTLESDANAASENADASEDPSSDGASKKGRWGFLSRKSK